MMAAKLGLLDYTEGDHVLFERLEKLLAQVETDMTLFYRLLASDTLSVEAIADAYYEPESLGKDYRDAMTAWLNDYQTRLSQDKQTTAARQAAMNKVNPKYIFRNYLAQQAIDKADDGDATMLNELLTLLKKPYDDQTEFEHYAAKRPDWARTKVGCSMLSCSS